MFAFDLRPEPLAVVAGEEPVALRVTTLAEAGFTAPVSYSVAGLPPFLSAPGSPISAAPGYPVVSLPVSAAASAPPGSYQGRVVGEGGGVRRERAFAVEVRPPLPVIEAASPTILVAGAVPQEVQLTGRNFQPGATVRSDSPAVRVEGVQVLSVERARVILSGLAGAGPARVRLDLVNPDGGATRDGAVLVLLPPDSLAAPLAITTVAVVFPRPGSHVAPRDPVFPRGVLAVTGSGTVVGSWLIGGTVFDRFVVQAVAGQPVAVAAHTPIPDLGAGVHELVLRVELPQKVDSPPVEVLQTRRRASALRLLAPDDGAVVAREELELRWSPVPGASAYRVEIEGQDPEQRLERRTAATRWRPDPRRTGRLREGTLRWRARPLFPGEVEGEPTPWRELVLLPEEVDGGEVSALAAVERTAARHLPVLLLGPGAHQAVRWPVGRATGRLLTAEERPEEEAFAEAPPERTLSWATEAEGTGKGASGDDPRPPDETLVSLSAQVDANGPAATLQAVADLAMRRELASEASTKDYTESWLIRGGARQGRFGQELQAGYATPAFLHGLEFLDGGLARGGAAAGVGSPGAISVSYFGSFDPELGVAATGDLGVEQELRAAALEVGGEGRPLLLRLVGLEVEDEPSPFAAGGRGRSFALFGRWEASPAAVLSVEAARGELVPGEGGFEEEREGYGYRIGLAGAAGTWRYGLALRRIEAGFVNPANRGLSAGGRSDRDAAELTVGKALGRSSLELGLQRVDGGDGWGPPARVDSTTARWSLPVTPAVNLSLGGTFAQTDVDPSEGLLLPANRRRAWSADLSLSESLGGFQLTQSLALQDQEDREDPTLDATTTNLSLGVFGTRGPLQLAGSLTGTRVEAHASQGRTESLAASLQPAWGLAAAWLRIRPYLAYSESRNDLFESRTTSEQYRLTVSWEPPWAASLLALEGSADASRTRDRLFDPEADFEIRYLAALVLRWGGQGSRPGVSASEHAALPPQGTLLALASPSPRRPRSPLGIGPP
ncbi:MAG TPA: hypothetical protein VM599_10690 [Thermoanaerobaculia bacterium]|nr:hypothetical protein [Thermoanaerobaculia bacterium]